MLLLVVMRLMGKRQIGELQPFEFAITLVVADLACLPMQDNTIPILYGVVPMFTMLLLHLIITKLCVKSVRFRRLVNGKPSVIINEGKIDIKTMDKLNMNTNDLLEALRCAGFFKIGEIECAVVETNGTVTVLPKFANSQVTNADLKIEGGKNQLPYSIIVEGRLLEDNLNKTNYKKEDIFKLLTRLSLEQKDVYLLSLSGDNAFIQPYKGDAKNALVEESVR